MSGVRKEVAVPDRGEQIQTEDGYEEVVRVCSDGCHVETKAPGGRKRQKRHREGKVWRLRYGRKLVDG
jgi:hypothetical protein